LAAATEEMKAPSTISEPSVIIEDMEPASQEEIFEKPEQWGS